MTMRNFPLGPIALAGMLAALAGCSTATKVEATIASDLPKAQQSARIAVNLWGIAKGIALVAEVAQPALVPVLAPAIAIGDPLAAAATLALNDTTADAGAVSSLAAQITTQANAITATAAPAVKVVSNGLAH
jgi:hypothetical protein